MLAAHQLEPRAGLELKDELEVLEVLRQEVAHHVHERTWKWRAGGEGGEGWERRKAREVQLLRPHARENLTRVGGRVGERREEMVCCNLHGRPPFQLDEKTRFRVVHPKSVWVWFWSAW